jgi:hypothetical protein
MDEEQAPLARLEFEHFISEFEAFKDIMLDQITSLRSDIEIISEKLDDIKKEAVSESRSQSKLS